MEGVTSDRLRWGALAWVLTLQFFVVEAVVQFRGESYSRVDDVISDLGATTWPGHQAMNASFVVQAALVLGGALLLRPALRGSAGRVAVWLFAVTAVGLLLVGVFPTDTSGSAHGVGAVAYLIGSSLGLIALAYALRPRSELLGSAVVLLGLIGAAATTFFLTGVDVPAEGVTERAAAYVLPIAFAVVGVACWRMGAGDTASPEGHVSRREERATARALAADRARERDEALEESARRTEAPSADRRVPGDDVDADDPWASTGRTD
jgi:hypothetical membrane protein